MTREEQALLEAKGALKALAAIEMGRCKARLEEMRLPDEDMQRAIADAQRQLDTWMATQLTQVTDWIMHPEGAVTINTVESSVH